MLQQLPAHLKDFIAREIAAGRYESEEQVIVVALERLADEDDDRITIAEAVAEPLAAMRRGEGQELTDELFDQLLRLSEEDALHGVAVSDDIRY